jgi:hypothetical protein
MRTDQIDNYLSIGADSKCTNYNMPDYQYSVGFEMAAKANSRSDSLPFFKKIMMRDVMSREL